MKRISHWIDGAVVASTSGRTGPVWNPATGEQQAEVDFASVDEVDAAVAAAAAAFPAWRATSLSRRVGGHVPLPRAGRRQPQGDRRRISRPSTARCSADAMGEVARGLENVEFACGIPHLLKGGFSEQASSGVDVYSIRQPLGVVAGITPFNFPAMVPMWMFANAIACGNTFVLKPSEKDPSASLFLAELLKSAGLPDGVFNVVQGDKVAVDRILEHPDIAAVSFVGSTPIARSTSTRRARRTASGCRPSAAPRTTWSSCPTPTSTWPPTPPCRAALRLGRRAVHGHLGRRRRRRRRRPAGRGHPVPAAEAAHRSRHRAGQRDGPARHRASTATRWRRTSTRGARPVPPSWSTAATPAAAKGEGFFLGVSLLDDVEPGMEVYTDEIFGPVLGVVRVDTYDEAVQLVNDNPYGNGTAIFTRDGGAARQFQFDVNCGMVGVNVPIPVPVAYYSFGGWKASLFGDTHMYGPDGVHFYTRTKVVTSRWPDPATSARRPRLPEDALRSPRWTSASSSRPTLPPGASSTWRARPSSWGSATSGPSTRTCCGRSRSSSTARSWRPPARSRSGPMVTNPATRDWTVTASLFATLNEMFGNRTICGIGRGDSAVRVTNGKPTTLATLRDVDPRHPRAGQRPRGRLQGQPPALPVGRSTAASTCGWRRTGPRRCS